MSSILVLCTGNSCRSQMAEAYFNALTGGHWRCESAGTEPAGYVHLLAIKAMKEDAIDITAYRSKPIAGFASEDWDYVVTVCDGAVETCPVFPRAGLLQHWPFSDPADCVGSSVEQLTAFRETRDAIKRRVSEFLEDLKRN